MQVVVFFYNGLDVPTRQILDSRGAIPSKTAADAKVDIQEMAEYSQKWHNGTSRTRSIKTFDGLAAIQAQLKNLGREIKKVNKKVYAAQEQYKPFVPRTKAIYGRNPKQIYGESAKRHEENSNLMKEIRASTDAAIKNQGASIKTLEIQIKQMSKSISTIVEADTSSIAVLDHTNSHFIILDMPEDIKVPLILGRSFLSTAHAKIDVFKRKITLRLRRDQVDDLMPTIEEGEVIKEFRARNDARMVSKIFGYPSDYDHDKKIRIDCAHNMKFSCMLVLEDMDAYRDEGMGDAIFHKPFLREVGINARRFKGIITIYNGNEDVTYQKDLAEKKSTTLVKYLQSGSVGILKSQDGCSTHILAHKLNLENLPSKISGVFLVLILFNSRF
ncbi:putative reverse transcriptase domain-containing protein [Tanacetum coccineum]